MPDIDTTVTRVYDSCRTIISEFVADGGVGGFTDIPMNVWYNALTSICALVMRMPALRRSERLQERVVFLVMLRIVQRDLPVSDDTRRTIEGIYRGVAPPIIDAIIPGARGSPGVGGLGCGGCAVV
jgi:hypothetical protein